MLAIHARPYNGFDLEVVVASTPQFGIGRLRLLLMGSPRHADVITFTGLLNQQADAQAKRTYTHLSHPKYAIAIGACMHSSDPFQDHYTVREDVNDAFPVDVFVPGCSINPELILNKLMKLKERGQRSHE